MCACNTYYHQLWWIISYRPALDESLDEIGAASGALKPDSLTRITLMQLFGLKAKDGSLEKKIKKARLCELIWSRKLEIKCLLRWELKYTSTEPAISDFCTLGPPVQPHGSRQEADYSWGRSSVYHRDSTYCINKHIHTYGSFPVHMDSVWPVDRLTQTKEKLLITSSHIVTHGRNPCHECSVCRT